MIKGKLINVRGDATEPQRLSDNELAIIPHVCNDEGKWGAGFVLALSKKWESPKQDYQRCCRVSIENNIPSLGKTRFSKVDDSTIVANMIAQRGIVSPKNPIPLKYRSLIRCMENVFSYVELHKLESKNPVVIHCPKFGSDLAGGDFRFILELIREIWLENGIDVVVYEFESDKSKWGKIKE